jgi:hypothetical protein
MNNEIEAIVESMMFVETKMQDKELATRLLNIYKDYLKKSIQVRILLNW